MNQWTSLAPADRNTCRAATTGYPSGSGSLRRLTEASGARLSSTGRKPFTNACTNDRNHGWGSYEAEPKPEGRNPRRQDETTLCSI
jgi:hypothetical protein